VEATKRPTRDYPSYSSTPWNLWDTVYARRSHRKYLPMEVEDKLVSTLRETVRLAVTVRGAGSESISVVTDADKVEGIRRKAYKGMQGKINLWLTRAHPIGFLVLMVPKEDFRSERPQELPLAAMAAEDCILWLTESGLGTCWLGGISQKVLKKVLGLGEDKAIPAIIPFGKPKKSIKARDFDSMIYRSLSRHRKPLTETAYMESTDSPYSLEELPEAPFAAAPVQDIGGLLNRLDEKVGEGGDAPLDLALEACLEAARVAPSGGNAQNWAFIAVTSEEKLRELARACGGREGWRAAVVGAGHPGGFESRMLDKPFWMLDLPIALSQMSLMAASMGCGVDMCVGEIYEEEVNRLVGLSSKNLRAVGVMGIR
jgi:nitroreductase